MARLIELFECTEPFLRSLRARTVNPHSLDKIPKVNVSTALALYWNSPSTRLLFEELLAEGDPIAILALGEYPTKWLYYKPNRVNEFAGRIRHVLVQNMAEQVPTESEYVTSEARRTLLFLEECVAHRSGIVVVHDASIAELNEFLKRDKGVARNWKWMGIGIAVIVANVFALVTLIIRRRIQIEATEAKRAEAKEEKKEEKGSGAEKTDWDV